MLVTVSMNQVFRIKLEKQNAFVILVTLEINVKRKTQHQVLPVVLNRRVQLCPGFFFCCLALYSLAHGGTIASNTRNHFVAAETVTVTVKDSVAKDHHVFLRVSKAVVM